jgi:putative ABC transport system permease protein
MSSDLRYAVRTILKAPVFAAVAMATIALGIGANTAIFSVVNGVLLRPLPFFDPDRIVQVWTATRDAPRSNHAPGDFLDLQRDNQSLAAIAGYRNALFSVAVNQREPEQFEGAYVTVDFFDILGVAAAAGRAFTRAEDAPPSAPLAVLSHRAAEQLFGSSTAAIGVRVRVNGEAHTITGVMPPRTEWPSAARLWVLSMKPVPPSPLDIADAEADRDVRYFEAIARLRPGVTLAQAQDDVQRVGSEIQRRHPNTAGGREIRLGVLREQIVGDVREALIVLQAAVGVVLLIACANVSSLLVTRASGRRRELAIRAALGASRSRLVRQLLTESLLLGATGGFLGLLLASWLVVLLLRVIPEGVPRIEEIGLDRVVSAVTLFTSLVTGIVFGVLPAVQGSRADAGAALKQSGGRTSAARAQGRAALVVAEVALTLVLLVGAGLLINSFLRLQRVDSGLQPAHVTVMSLAIPQSRYPTGRSQTELYRRLLEGLAQRPEIQASGVGFPGPLRGSNASGGFFIERREDTSRADRSFAHLGSVSGGYFAAMGIPLIAGRTFADADRRDGPGAAIVSVTLARKYWPGEQAVGKRIRFDPKGNWATVVGMVGDVRQLGLHEPPPPILYLPYQQFPLPFTHVAVRSSAPDGTVASLLRTQITVVDPQIPPGEMATLRNILNRSVDEPRFRSLCSARLR